MRHEDPVEVGTETTYQSASRTKQQAGIQRRGGLQPADQVEFRAARPAPRRFRIEGNTIIFERSPG